MSARVLGARLREYLADPVADDPAGLGVPLLAIRAARDRLLGARPHIPRPGVAWVTMHAPHLVLAAAPAAAVVLDFVARLE